MPQKKKEPSFEQDLAGLEAIVEALEEGGLSLDESVKQFEQGMKLWKRCEKALAEAEKRIEVLMENAEGDLDTEPLDAGEAAPEAAKPLAGAKEAPAKAEKEGFFDDGTPVPGEVEQPEEDDELLF